MAKATAYEKLMLAAEDPEASEHAIQSAVFAHAKRHREQHPELALLASIPNGGDRNMIVASMMKKEGVLPGFWDIILPVPAGGYNVLCIEMKRPQRRTEPYGGLSESQLAFGGLMHHYGACTRVCYTWREAWETIEYYLMLRRAK